MVLASFLALSLLFLAGTLYYLHTPCPHPWSSPNLDAVPGPRLPGLLLPSRSARWPLTQSWKSSHISGGRSLCCTSQAELRALISRCVQSLVVLGKGPRDQTLGEMLYWKLRAVDMCMHLLLFIYKLGDVGSRFSVLVVWITWWKSQPPKRRNIVQGVYRFLHKS
jgi:hypothetical protein